MPVTRRSSSRGGGIGNMGSGTRAGPGNDGHGGGDGMKIQALLGEVVESLTEGLEFVVDGDADPMGEDFPDLASEFANVAVRTKAELQSRKQDGHGHMKRGRLGAYTEVIID